MGNLEGWGGPVSQKWIDGRVELQKKIVNRMHELGIEPVFQGFYGMVPHLLEKKYPHATIYDLGYWGGDSTSGFYRPPILEPTDSLFTKISAVYYEQLQKLYGKNKFFGGDPFHELSGSLSGINITKAATAIQQDMLKANDKAVWVLQGWLNNPLDPLLAGIDKEHTLVLDLFCESHPNYNKRNSFNDKYFVWSIISNFGSNTGLNFLSDSIIKGPVEALKSKYSSNLKGIGMMMEGDETLPYIYELLFSMAWKSDTVNALDCLNKYSLARYGILPASITKANELLLKTVYNAGGGGIIESILCARPGLDLKKASTWGSAIITYNTKTFERAVFLFAQCSEMLKNNDGYNYDITDFTRQVLVNRVQGVYDSICYDYKLKNILEFNKHVNNFTELLKDINNLLSSRDEFLLGRWIETAKSNATDEQEKKLFEWNARMLITLWGDKNANGLVHDYSFREWNGLISDFYLPRWQLYFDNLRKKLEGRKTSDVDFYSWELNWTKGNNYFSDKPEGNPTDISISILKKYKVLN